MEQKEALELLSDGHTIVAPERAEEVCRLAGVAFDRAKLVQRWRSDPPGTAKGLQMAPGQENTEGVYSLTLGYYLAEQLQLGTPGGAFNGRGFQARANADAIAVKLGWRTV